MLVLPFVALALLLAIDFLLLRGVRAAVLHAAGARDAALFGPEPPFEVKPAIRVAVAVAAIAAGYLASGLLVAAGMAAVGEMHPTTAVRVAPGSPAAHAGMRDGDRIESIGDDPIEEFEQVAPTLKIHAGEPVSIGVMRRERLVELVVTPGPPGAPNAGRIGVAAVMARGPVPTWELVKIAATWPARQWAGLGGVIAGQERRDVMGPTAIVRAIDGAPPPDAGWVVGFALMLTGGYQAWVLVLLGPLAFWGAKRRADLDAAAGTAPG